MFSAPWAWEVKSPRIQPATLLLIEWSGPWRLMLDHRLCAVYDDWYLHAVFLSALLFGFLFFPDRGSMRECERLRWLALLLGVVAYVARTSYTRHDQHLPVTIELKVVMAFVYGCDQWGWIVVAAGFAYRHLLTAEGPGAAP